MIKNGLFFYPQPPVNFVENFKNLYKIRFFIKYVIVFFITLIYKTIIKIYYMVVFNYESKGN